MAYWKKGSKKRGSTKYRGGHPATGGVKGYHAMKRHPRSKKSYWE